MSEKVLLLYGIHDYLMVYISFCLNLLSEQSNLGNFPNQSDRFRIVQYITFQSAKEGDEHELTSRIDAFHMRRLSSKVDEQLAGFPEPQLTELGEKIIGIRSWKTNEKVKSSFE
jgi:hypothetical protein